MYSDYSKSRKWLITINNPEEKALSDNDIIAILKKIKSISYYCISHEIGAKDKTPHIHIFIYATNTIRFSTIKKHFHTAHIDKANGTAEQNRDYVFKIGKWKDTEKGTTNIEDSHFEFGELPEERQGKRSDLDTLYHYIKEGKTDYEILETNSAYAGKLDTISKVRKTVLEEKYKSAFRELEVTYIYGKTGTGKTRSVMEEFGYENVYRITDYVHPFDNYQQQEVVIFEEYRSDLKIGVMLNFLDGYPLSLPCRYADKVACFTKVFIISNISLKEQYKNIQNEQPESFKAFLRRINKVKIYTDSNLYKEVTTDEFFNPKQKILENGFAEIEPFEKEELPFQENQSDPKIENN